MRIAFMHRQLRGGGTEADLRRMAGGLAARGHELHVFCMRAGVSLPGVATRRVPVPAAGRVARVLGFALMAPRLVARERWDAVVGFGRTPRQDVARIGGGTHRSYLRRMTVAGVRGRRLGPYHRAILWIEGRQFSPAGHRRVLAVSDSVRREVVADYAVPPAQVAVVYNGVDLEQYHPTAHATAGAAVRQALAVPPDTRLCVAIGSGFARKGMDLLLHLWSEQPPDRMVLAVVGGDERLDRFRRHVAARGLTDRVRVLGRRDDVPAILAAADVLCVPSRQEAFGNVVLEACAAGVPVVTSRLVGAAELLDGPCGRLVVERPDDLPALRAALHEATGTAQAALGTAARALAERHPWHRHLDEVEALLREVAGD